MIFTRRYDITLTYMAKWLDSHVCESDEDKNTQVEYLYHLILCKAKQDSLFTDNDIYDDFTLFCISKILIRISNKEEAPIKSVVNYIRTVIHPWYAEYIKNFCTGSINVDNEFDITDFGDYLIDQSSEDDYHTLLYDGFVVTDVLKKHLQKIPHKKFSAEWTNICISCYLTINDRISSAICLTDQLKNTKSASLLSRLIRGLKNRPPILFHVEETMSGYVNVLVNELTHVMAVELTETVGTRISSEDCLKNLVSAAQNKEGD